MKLRKWATFLLVLGLPACGAVVATTAVIIATGESLPAICAPYVGGGDSGGNSPSPSPSAYGNSRDLSLMISNPVTSIIAKTDGLSVSTSMYGKVPEFRQPDQLSNADIMNRVGLARGLSVRERALVLATSIQETDMHNLTGGDRDSVGLFQQRPSQGWGTVTQIMDPVYATNAFINALLSKTTAAERESLPLMELAMKVQRPDPAAYASRWRWDVLAAAIVGSADVSSAITAQQVSGIADLCARFYAENTSNALTTIVNAGLAQVGTRYILGASAPGDAFDCSGLTQYLFGLVGINLPRVAQQQYEFTKPYSVSRSNLQKGDLLFFDTIADNGIAVDHVGIYWGNNQMLHAPNPSKAIGVYDLGDPGGYYWTRFVGASRPLQSLSSNAVFSGAPSGSWLIPKYPISSAYGLRYHPVKGVWKLHDGTDYGAPCGAPNLAIQNGAVTRVYFESGGGGLIVEVSHGRYVSRYEHNASASVKPGQNISKGDTVGLVGATGSATGCHLHLTIVDTTLPDTGWGSQTIDPVSFFAQINRPEYTV